MTRSTGQEPMNVLLDRMRHPPVSDGERRNVMRHMCHVAAKLYIDAHVIDAVVEDLGDTGCRIRFIHSRIGVGNSLIVDMPSRGICRQGTVAWMRGGEAGVHFDARQPGASPEGGADTRK